MKTKLGNPACCTIQCKHLVAGVLTLFDPTVVKCSWLKPGGIEDAQTYGGTDPRDSLLTKISTGVYQAIYITDVVGNWKVIPYWSHTSGGVTLSFEKTTPESLVVLAKEATQADAPVTP